MKKYQLDIALWQIPTMVVAPFNSEEKTRIERQSLNVMSNTGIDQRVGLLEYRVGKAAAFFENQVPSGKTKVVTVFAAPEYLFASRVDSHFLSEEDKDRLLAKLKDLSERFPNIVLFPGTIAWKISAKRSGKMAMFKSSRGKKAKKQIDSYKSYQSSTKKRFETKLKGDENYFLAENTCYVLNKGKVLLEYQKRNDGGEVNRGMDGDDVFWVPGKRDPYFAHAGIDFGLQICAEMGSPLSRAVDLQVAISASHPIRLGSLRLRSGGYACHADAFLKPRVICNDPDGGLEDVVANVQRRGGGTLSKVAATSVAQDIAPKKITIKEQTTILRGRSRYYVLEYNKA